MYVCVCGPEFIVIYNAWFMVSGRLYFNIVAVTPRVREQCNVLLDAWTQ